MEVCYGVTKSYSLLSCTDGQEYNTSLEDQEERILAFSKSQGIDIVAVFRDTASGTNTNRQGYQDALEYITENNVNCFVVAKFDRAHRNQLNLLSFQKDLQEQGNSIISSWLTTHGFLKIGSQFQR